MKSSVRTWVSDLILLSLIIGIFYSLFLGTRPLMSPDEGRYAEIAREMLATHHYITPHLNGVKYFEKPPLFYWMSCAAIYLGGLSEWSLRIVSAFMGLVGCLLVYVTSRKIFGRLSAWFASLILAANALYYILAHFITPDMTVSVFLSATLFAFILGNNEPPGMRRNYYMWGMYVFAALATLSKGLIGIVFPGLIILVWLLVMNKWRSLKTYCIPTGIVIFLIIAAPWHILVQIHNPEFFRFYFIDQHFLRYFTDYAQREQSWYFLPLCLILGFFPWICFLPQTIRLHFFATWQERHLQMESIFFMLWAVLILLFFMLSQSQLLSYALPIVPALAILTGHYLADVWQRKRSYGFMASIIVIFVMAASIAGLGFYITHKKDYVFAISDGRFYVLLSAAIMAIGATIALLLQIRQKIKPTLCVLFISISLFLISINLSYTAVDTRPVKSLALILKPLLKPDSEVFCYRYYYQDLPVYLQRKVIIVDWEGELAFGMRHQRVDPWIIDEKTLWLRWNNGRKMFMMMTLNDYKRILASGAEKLYLLAQTPRYALVTNRP